MTDDNSPRNFIPKAVRHDDNDDTAETSDSKFWGVNSPFASRRDKIALMRETAETDDDADSGEIWGKSSPFASQRAQNGEPVEETENTENTENTDENDVWGVNSPFALKRTHEQTEKTGADVDWIDRMKRAFSED